MYKYLYLLIIPLFLSFAVPAAASNLGYEDKRAELIQKRQAIQEQISILINDLAAIEDDEAKQPVINSIIQLTQQDNKLAAYEKAYAKALEIDDVVNLDSAAASASYQKANLLPGQFVPAAYVPLYKAAGQRYGVDWSLLAAIHKVETDFSRIKNMVSYAGALGHMQFMPATFKGYGVDGNGNGIRSPWELEDAVYSAANYLAANGVNMNVRKAIWHYNHSESYIDKVLGIARTIKGVID